MREKLEQLEELVDALLRALRRTLHDSVSVTTLSEVPVSFRTKKESRCFSQAGVCYIVLFYVLLAYSPSL